MDFGDARYNRDHYEVSLVWTLAACIGFVNTGAGVGWAFWRWSKSSMIWHVQEDDETPERNVRNLSSM